MRIVPQALFVLAACAAIPRNVQQKFTAPLGHVKAAIARAAQLMRIAQKGKSALTMFALLPRPDAEAIRTALMDMPA